MGGEKGLAFGMRTSDNSVLPIFQMWQLQFIELKGFTTVLLLINSFMPLGVGMGMTHTVVQVAHCTRYLPKGQVGIKIQLCRACQVCILFHLHKGDIWADSGPEWGMAVPSLPPSLSFPLILYLS